MAASLKLTVCLVFGILVFLFLLPGNGKWERKMGTEYAPGQKDKSILENGQTAK